MRLKKLRNFQKRILDLNNFPCGIINFSFILPQLLQLSKAGKGLIQRALAGQSPGNLDFLLSFRRDRISATHLIRVLNFLQRCGNDTLLFRLTTAGFRMDETESIAEQKH
jgi:hypothetical protein